MGTYFASINSLEIMIKPLSHLPIFSISLFLILSFSPFSFIGMYLIEFVQPEEDSPYIKEQFEKERMASKERNYVIIHP
jgi:hypothetical protein